MSEILFSARDLSRHFKSGRNTVRALDGVSFDLFKGETLSLVGESGCGKTTCARTMLGIYAPTSGSVRWRGHEVSGLKGRELTDFRRRNQMIFQDPYLSLDPRMTVSQIIEEGMRRHFSLTADERRARVMELLRTVNLTEEFASRFPHELSGGQRQRVGIARALALQPECLVCDEPIAALDASIQAQVVNLLMDLQRQRGLTYLMISHDLTMVRHISERVAVMYLGGIVELADAEALYQNPLHPYTRALLSAVPVADPESRWLQNRAVLSGEVPSPIHVPSGCRFCERCSRANELCRASRPALREVEPGHWAACLRVE